MMIGTKRGDPYEGRGWGCVSYAALSNIWCQGMGIVFVPSWILMRQKRGWCRGRSMTENPTTEGGGEYWQLSNGRMPCQKKGYDTSQFGVAAWVAARCSVWRPCYVSRALTRPKKGSLFHQQTLSICWTSGPGLCEPEVSAESHHVRRVLFHKLSWSSRSAQADGRRVPTALFGPYSIIQIYFTSLVFFLGKASNKWITEVKSVFSNNYHSIQKTHSIHFVETGIS